jgi:hypothetical protein
LKIGVISDSHGNLTLAQQAIEKMGEVDLYIHLGDYIKDAQELFGRLNKTYIAVKGNCDLTDDEEEMVIELNGKKFFISHGHKYHIKYGYNNIYYKALEWDADVVLFGHTHMPVSIWYQGILFLNPGSTTYPRGVSNATYGIIEIEEGEIYPQIYEL